MTSKKLQITASGVGVFLGLHFGLNPGVSAYLFRTPGAFAGATLIHWWGNVLLPLLLAAGLLSGVRFLGEYLLKLVIRDRRLPGWHPILELALGAATAALALLLLGSLGLFRVAVLQIAGAGLIVFGVKSWIYRRNFLPHGDDAFRGLWAGVAAGLLAYLAWNAVVHALAPPTDIDVLKYHLVLPELYLRSNQVEAIPWQVFSHWPQSMEMLYSLALVFHSDAAAALLHTGVCGLIVLLTYRLAREEFGLDATAATVAACLLASQPVLIREAGAAMTDGTLALFYLLSCACLRRWHNEKDLAWLKLAGLMAGAAAAVKLHGAILLVGLAGWLTLSAILRAAPGGLRNVGVFFLWAAVFATPWYAKEWISSGNPVWPFLPKLFGGRWGAAAVAALISPEAVTLNYHWIFIGEGAAFLLIPAGAALAWAAWRRERPAAVGYLAPALLYLPAAATAISFWRYMLPFYPALALVAGWGFSRAAREGRLARGLAVVFLAFGLSGVVRATYNNELFPVIGLRSKLKPDLSPREAYLSRALTGHDFTRAVNAALRQTDRVLLIAENRGYYLTREYMYGDPSEQGVLDYASASGPGELRTRLARWGITHLAISEDDDWYADAVRRSDPRTYALVLETARRYGTKMLTVQRRTLYALNPVE